MSIVERRFKSNSGPFEFTIKERRVLQVGLNGPIRNVDTKTSNYTMTNEDHTLAVNTSGGAVTITLPPNPEEGQEAVIKKTTSNANALTVSGNGNTIDGLSSVGTGATVDLVSLRLTFNSGVWRDT